MTSSPPAQPGAVWGQFRLAECLSREPWCEVWRGNHTLTGEEARLLLVPAELLGEQVGRLVTSLPGLSHPYLLVPASLCLIERHLVIVARPATGEPLTRHLKQGPIPWPSAAEIANQALDALACLHDCGFLYGPLTPERTLLTDDGTVLLVDVGLWQVLAHPPPSPAGPYQPPSASVQGDLWAVGTFLWAMVSGQEPPADLPPLTACVPDAPPALDRFIAACRLRGFADASEARAALIELMRRELHPGAVGETIGEHTAEALPGTVHALDSQPEAQVLGVSDPEARIRELEQRRKDKKSSAAVAEELETLRATVGRLALAAVAGQHGTAVLRRWGTRWLAAVIAYAIPALLGLAAVWWTIWLQVNFSGLALTTGSLIAGTVLVLYAIIGVWLALALGVTRTRILCYAQFTTEALTCSDEATGEAFLHVPARDVLRVTLQGPPGRQADVVRVLTRQATVLTVDFAARRCN